MKKAKTMLIAFYNKKALGVRYLEGALLRDGHAVHTVYFKDFNSLQFLPQIGIADVCTNTDDVVIYWIGFVPESEDFCSKIVQLLADMAYDLEFNHWVVGLWSIGILGTRTVGGRLLGVIAAGLCGATILNL